MAGRYSIGETKVRPGIYFRQENGGGNEVVGATNGIVAVAFKANWGKLGEVVTVENPADIPTLFGDDSGSNSNTAILNAIFTGGASQILAVRVGTGGTKAAITLKDTTSGTAVDVVTLTAKFAGTRDLSVTIKDSLSITTMRECIIYSGTKELSKVLFEKGSAGEVDAIVAAINASEECVVTAAKLAAGNGTMASITQTSFTTAGVSPTITSTDYSDAFTLLEATKWNAVCIDSNDTSVHALLKAFINRANDAGLMGVAFLGEPTSVAYATRKTDAAAFNSENVAYVLNGFGIGSDDYEGWKAAALAAGYYAFLPSNDSLTHKQIPGATRIIGALTNTQVIECLQSGALVFTVSASGNVWFEQGINTLVSLRADQDAGWKKLRRTKTRFELIDRINVNTEDIIGTVNNDDNGRATFLARCNAVGADMIAEGKLQSFEASESSSNLPRGDSAWFVFDVLDNDSMEHIYLTYMFRFSET